MSTNDDLSEGGVGFWERYYSNNPALNYNAIETSTASLSPDEMVIRSRGKRQPARFLTPERDIDDDAMNNNPPKALGSQPARFSTPERDGDDDVINNNPPKAPRKKLLNKNKRRMFLQPNLNSVKKKLDFINIDDQFLGQIADPCSSPKFKKFKASDESENEGLNLVVEDEKKKKLSLTSSASITSELPGPLKLARGLSKDQLVDLFEKLSIEHPIVAARLEELLPKPDLTGLLNKMVYLRLNIYKAFPVSRLWDRKSSYVYQRVASHLAAFKKQLVEDLNMLLGSCQWDSLLEYVCQVWQIVKNTPEWETDANNYSRNSCFKQLSASVLKVLKLDNFSIHAKTKYELIDLMEDSKLCEIKSVRQILMKK